MPLKSYPAEVKSEEMFFKPLFAFGKRGFLFQGSQIVQNNLRRRL
jgi:hypothetical protein